MTKKIKDDKNLKDVKEESKETIHEEKVVKEDLEEKTEQFEEEEKAEEKKEENSAKTEVSQEEESTRYMRLMADFQNYKKRVEKQRSETFAFANEKIMTKLLEVMDNFERGLEANSEGEGFKDGMEMILKQLKDVLIENGLSEMETENKVFDPNLHNAVLMEDVENVESGLISGTLQKGYTLNGKVIRPAMVKVAK